MNWNFYSQATVATFLVAGISLAPAFAQDEQLTFESPEEAVDALAVAVESYGHGELELLFGPRVEELKSGDPNQDDLDLQRFSAALQRGYFFQEPHRHERNLVVGYEAWEFPVPIVRENRRWRFDTDAGVEEVLTRRIGQNELDAIWTCQQYAGAQRRYFTIDPNQDGIGEYAQRLLSTPGTRDGLFWPQTGDAPVSPIGALVAYAVQRGDLEATHDPQPYRGYYFKILKRQGPNAPGGAIDYLDNLGRMTNGYALVAWPAEYGKTGVTTFMISHYLIVYESDLGEETGTVAPRIQSFDPGSRWRVVAEADR